MSAGSPLPPGAFYNFATKILLLTSFIIRRGINTAINYNYSLLSFIITGNRRKNPDISLSAYLILFLILDPFLLINSGILLNTRLLSGSKYLAAY